MRSHLISAEQQLSALRAAVRVGMAGAAETQQSPEETLFETRLTDAKKVSYGLRNGMMPSWC